MKKIIILYFLLHFFVGTGLAQNSTINNKSLNSKAYFYTGAPARLEFIRNDHKGKLIWTQHAQYDSIVNKENTSYIHYSSYFFKKNDKAIYPKMPLSVIIKNGEVTIDIGESVASIVREATKGLFKVTHEGDMITVPYDMQPGDTLSDISCEVKMAGMVLTVTIDERIVLRNETLVTPAGEFDCVVMSEHKVEKGLTRNRNTMGLNWYCRGLGIIRHDTYDMKGNLMSTEVLNKINF